MAAVIEEADERLRSLLSAASVRLEDGPAAVLPVLERFCREPFDTESDMLLWEVGDFSEWIESPSGDWTEGPPQWMFAISRQFERGDEADATDDEPAGFFQVRCAWYFAPGPRSSFEQWRHDEPIEEFFGRIAQSPEMEVAATQPLVRAELVAEWV